MSNDLQPGDYLLCHCRDPPVKITKDDCIQTSQSEPIQYTYACPNCGKTHKACPTCMNRGEFFSEDGTRYTCHNCFPEAAQNQDRRW